MSRDLERCPTTGALVDACRHCADDLPCDTPEHDDPEETPVTAPAPPAAPEAPDRVEAIVTLTWTAHVSAPVDQLAGAEHQLGLPRADVLTVIASQAITRAPWVDGVQVVPVGPNGIVVSAVTLVDADVQALP